MSFLDKLLGRAPKPAGHTTEELDKVAIDFVRRIDERRAATQPTSRPPFKVQTFKINATGDDIDRVMMNLPRVVRTDQVSPNSNAH